MSDAMTHVTIFHTNDMHGRIEGMGRLSYVARQQRAEAEAVGRQVFFWDAGDAADRRHQLFSISKGAVVVDILQEMGVTLQTMGNAISLPYGIEAITAVVSRANFPILAANCRDGDGPLMAGLQEAVLLPLENGLTLGVFGLTAPWGGFYEMFGLHFPDSVATASRLTAELRQAGADVVIFLSHLGIDDDHKVAEAVPDIDVIIGGHSHTLLPEGEMHHSVLIAQAGHFTEHLGRVDLTFSAAGKLVSRSAAVIPVPETGASDPAILAMVAKLEEEVAAMMAERVGHLAAALDLNHFAECGVGNFAADVLRQRMKAEVAVVASGLFHHGLPAGEVTLGLLNDACFSSANPGVSVMTGTQLLAGLERGLDPAIYENVPMSMRGTPYGMPQISGMQVTYDLAAPVGQRIQGVLVNGVALDATAHYRVAHTDAAFAPEIGYFVHDGAPQYEVPTIVREAMADYLQQRESVPLPQGGRWVAVVK